MPFARFIRSVCRLALISWCLAPSQFAGAADPAVFNLAGHEFNVPLTTLKELRFRGTVRQQYDFSCGSAALATLLTYHYERPVTEQVVFDAMFNLGNQEKIRVDGFSLFDMKRYLDTHGFIADGFRAPLERLLQAGVPAIVLIQKNGYRHFVVVKGVSAERVLVGDPAAGTLSMPRAEFEAIWNGLLFVIRNEHQTGTRYFNRGSEWNSLARAPLDLALPATELANLTWRLRGANDY